MIYNEVGQQSNMEQVYNKLRKAGIDQNHIAIGFNDEGIQLIDKEIVSKKLADILVNNLFNHAKDIHGTNYYNMPLFLLTEEQINHIINHSKQ